MKNQKTKTRQHEPKAENAVIVERERCKIWLTQRIRINFSFAYHTKRKRTGSIMVKHL